MAEEISKPYSAEQGEQLVRTARYVVDSVTSSTKFSRWIAQERLDRFTQKHGLFVTIEHYPTKSLRGCIGFTTAAKPVREMLVDAAIAAAEEDPRFVPVSHMELDHIIIEVSVLTEPTKVRSLTPEGIKRQIKVGRDGIVVRHGYNAGLLLPIVAVENNWDAKEFLENACIKAGLPKDKWKSPDVTIERFSSQVFRETSPKGRIEEVIFQ